MIGIARVVAESSGETLGTAFLVDDLLAITAFHVVGNRTSKQLIEERIRLSFPVRSASSACVDVGVLVQDFDSEADLALLRLLDHAPAGVAPVRLRRSAAVFERWRSVGFPQVRGTDTFAITGEVSDPSGRIQGGAPAIQLLAMEALAMETNLAGISGAPVLVGGPGAIEAAVGVIRWAPRRTADLGAVGGALFATPTESIIERWPFLIAAPPDLLAPHELPSPPAGFVGRREELSEVVDHLRPASRTPAAVNIYGGPGVGKTVLAAMAANVVSDAYPDGQLYASLKNQDDGQLAGILDEWMAALGAAPAPPTATLDRRLAAFRSVLTSRRILIFIDDASRPEHIASLIPSSGESAIIVTSRAPVEVASKFPSYRLGVPRPSDALAILEGGAGVARVERESAAAMRLVALCGRLPLALRLISARVARQPTLALEHYAARVQIETERLEALAVDGVDIRAVLANSTRDLDPLAVRLNHFLGYSKLSTPSTGAAAAVSGLSLADAERGLAALLDAQVVEFVGPDRWRQHDLLRLTAAAECRETESVEELQEARVRLQDHIIQTANEASATFVARGLQRGTTTGEAAFRSAVEAQEWLKSELDDLPSQVEWALAESDAPTALAMVDAFSPYLDVAKKWHAALRLREAAVGAAEMLGDPLVLSDALIRVGFIYRELRRLEDAERVTQRAVDLLSDHVEPEAEEIKATVLIALGLVLVELRRFSEALDAYLTALSTCNRMLTSSGQNHAEALSEKVHQRARYLFAVLLNNMGEVYRQARAPDDAIPFFEERLNFQAAAEDDYGRSLTLVNLGAARLDQGEVDKAMQSFRIALDLSDRLGDAFVAARAHDGLGRALARVSQWDDALLHLRESRRLREELGNARGEAAVVAAMAGLIAKRHGRDASLPLVAVAVRLLTETGQAEAAAALEAGEDPLLASLL